MTLIDLIGDLHKHGKEFHGPCPFCGTGEDRFVVWPDGGRDDTGRFWCRRCETQGDAIDYLKQIKGATYAEALETLGLQDDEYTKNYTPVFGGMTTTSNGQHAEEIYLYTDEKGDLLFEVVRGSDKKFRQRIPTENGYSYRVKGVRRVLYRLPEIEKAKQSEKAVFLVEGEKDVHTLEKCGIVATTSPQGSSAWNDGYADLLKGVKEVVLIPDRDKPGLKYAASVVESLKSRQIPYRIIHLPYNLVDTHGKDITDWMEERDVSYSQAREEIGAMYSVGGQEVWELDKPYPKPFTLEELLARDFKPPEWVVPAVLPFGVTLLIAKPKTGKTFFALSVAHALATGGKALGSIQVKPGRVLYLVLEDSQRGLQSRMRHITELGGDTSGRLMFSNQWEKLDEDGLNHLDLFLGDNPDTRLVIIDTLKRVRPSGDHRKGIYDNDYEAIFPLTQLGDIHDCSFLVIHHANKQTEIDDPADLASGSTGLTGAAENIMVMRRTTDHEGVNLWMRGRDAEEIEMALVFDQETLSWKYEGDSREYGISEQRKKILDIIRKSEEPMTAAEISDVAEANQSTTRTLLSKMVHDGILSKAGYGKYKTNLAHEWDSISKPVDTVDSVDTPERNDHQGSVDAVDSRPF